MFNGRGGKKSGREGGSGEQGGGEKRKGSDQQLGQRKEG